MGVEKLLMRNAYNARFFLAGLGTFTVLYNFIFIKPRVKNEVFGWDGNGGKMLKIITDLTDEEMARLKYVRRLAWHWKGSRQMDYGRETISDQELSDRGIALP